MSATIDKKEVTDQQADEARPAGDDRKRQPDARSRRLERINPVTGVFGVLALCVAIVALLVALGSRGDNASRVVDRAPTAPAANSAQPAAMGGSHGGMSMAGTSAAKGKVSVALGDFWVKPSAAAVKAGKVTFAAHNVGKVEHELMIERMPLKMDGPGRPNEDAAQGMIDDMQPGQSGHMTLTLKPGRYVLFCNVEGHYAAGQHLPFTVTR